MIVLLTILSILFLIQVVIPKARLKDSGLFGIWAFGAAILAIFGFAFYQSWQQYEIWKNDAVGKFLLPPYQSLDYFVFYVRSRFFNPHFFSLFVGILAFLAAKILNKNYNERFFEPVEPYLFAAAIFSAGHPLWLFYLVILLAIFLIANFSLFALRFPLNKKMPRLSLYYWWLPAAIFTILINRWLSVLPWWQILRI